jgi:hypothetical protein
MPVCCETTCCSDQPLVSACQDRQTREPRPVEGPCPLCGAIQEYWNDEISSSGTGCVAGTAASGSTPPLSGI